MPLNSASHIFLLHTDEQLMYYGMMIIDYWCCYEE